MNIIKFILGILLVIIIALVAISLTRKHEPTDPIATWKENKLKADSLADAGYAKQIAEIKRQLPKKAAINGWDAQSETMIPIINIWDTCNDDLRKQKFGLFPNKEITLIDYTVKDQQKWYKLVSQAGDTGWVKSFFIKDPIK